MLSENDDYGTKFNRGKINTTKIQLPVVNNEIDFTFMKTFISTIQKLLIKDLVLYVDKKQVLQKSSKQKTPQILF